MLTSPYVLGEVTKNLGKLPSAAIGEWASLKEQIVIVNDIVSLSFPVVFTASKDRPILFSALAWSQVLLTLDRQEFARTSVFLIQPLGPTASLPDGRPTPPHSRP